MYSQVLLSTLYLDWMDDVLPHRKSVMECAARQHAANDLINLRLFSVYPHSSQSCTRSHLDPGQA